MKKLIKEQLKKLGISQASYCELIGARYEHFTSRVKTLENALNKLNKHLKHVKLRVIIVEEKEVG